MVKVNALILLLVQLPHNTSARGISYLSTRMNHSIVSHLAVQAVLGIDLQLSAPVLIPLVLVDTCGAEVCAAHPHHQWPISSPRDVAE